MFNNILGNDRNKKILEKAVELRKTSHSYIFSGAEGIGKKLIAKGFSKKILCLDDKKDECNCKSCIEFDSDRYLCTMGEEVGIAKLYNLAVS